MTADDRFQSLYKRFYIRVVKFFMRSFHCSEDDAKDFAQETFMRVLRAMDEYRGDAEWAFLEVTARHVAYNSFRSQAAAKRRGQTEDIDDPKTKMPSVPPPDHAAQQEKEIQRRQLHEEIAKLPAGQRESMQLWLDGFSYEEIARFLRVSVDAVKSRIRDARRRLREKLGADMLPKDDES
jgi:RNA polymerase sigma-70 factor (ECF subfamily)